MFDNFINVPKYLAMKIASFVVEKNILDNFINVPQNQKVSEKLGILLNVMPFSKWASITSACFSFKPQMQYSDISCHWFEFTTTVLLIGSQKRWPFISILLHNIW